ncbi:hypothetical protein V5F38_05045 [Xanthobacter sp. V0B-10]|uniref:hypothetical protein n=1 Tax=Xanthobacter albus TaxID=3119929 RepID=UPI0037284B57
MYRVIIALALIALPGGALAQSCKSAKTCAEAVEMWCDGYTAADRDDDGIPCENVCKSKKQVEAIMKKTATCVDKGEAKETAADDGEK